MGHYKIIRKKDYLFVDIPVKNNQTINQRDVSIVENGVNDFFLPLSIESKKSSSVLRYYPADMITLFEFLEMKIISKRMFFSIIEQFIAFDKQLGKNYLGKNATLFDEKLIFVDPQTMHIKFIYVPLQPFERIGSVREILQNLIQYATFDSNEDLQFVQDYIKIISDDVSFSMFKLEQYFEESKSEKTNMNFNRKCRNCGFILKHDDSICPVCSIPVVEEVFKSSIAEQKDTRTCEDETERMTDFKEKSRLKHQAFLINEGDSKQVDHFPFHIGTRADPLDFKIQNKYVSRMHAKIIKENEKFYMIDLESTNGTYINGRKIKSLEKEELRDGDELIFANVPCKFIIQSKVKAE